MNPSSHPLLSPATAAVLDLLHPQHVDGEKTSGHIILGWDPAYVSGSDTKNPAAQTAIFENRSRISLRQHAGDGLWVKPGRFLDPTGAGKNDEVCELNALWIDCDAKQGRNIDGVRAALLYDLDPRLLIQTSANGGHQAFFPTDRIIARDEVPVVLMAWQEKLRDRIESKVFDAVYDPSRFVRAWDGGTDYFKVFDKSAPIFVDELIGEFGEAVDKRMESALKERVELGTKPGDWLRSDGISHFIAFLQQQKWHLAVDWRPMRGGAKRQLWRRPRKSSGYSASLIKRADGVYTFYLFSDSVTGLAPGSHTPLHVMSVLMKRDHDTISREINQRGTANGYTKWEDAHTQPPTEAAVTEVAEEESEEKQVGDWEAVDLEVLWDSDPLLPTIGATHSQPLFYVGCVNTLFGDSTVGKSWIALDACLQEIRKGNWALWFDYEDSPRTIVTRMRALGATKEELTRLRYLNPISHLANATDEDRELLLKGVTILVLDSTGEAIGQSGGDSNDSDDVVRIFQALRLWRTDDAAIVLIDHRADTAAAETRKPMGSTRKIAAVDGAMYRIDLGHGFSRAKDGWVRVVCTKDRHGARAVKEVCARIDYKTSPVTGQLTLAYCEHVGEAPIEGEVKTKRFDMTVLDQAQRIWDFVHQNPGKYDSFNALARAMRDSGIPCPNRVSKVVLRLRDAGALEVNGVGALVTGSVDVESAMFDEKDLD